MNSDFSNTAFNQPQRGKDILLPMFYRRAVQDKLASEKEGRPIFREENYVQIHIPGDKNTIIDRKVREEDKQRWASQWSAFQENAAQPVEGTLLEQWPALSVAQIAELKALHIPTIEILANLPESGLQRIGLGARELQARAKAFLDAAKGNGAVERIAAENSRMQEQVLQLQQQNQKLQESLEQLKQELDRAPKRQTKTQ